MNEQQRKHLVFTCCCFVLGVPFFFGFFFGAVYPRLQKISRTYKTSCLILSVTDESYACHYQECSYCGCGSATSCSSRISAQTEGKCCGSRCCARDECEGCYEDKESCSGSGKDRKCTTERVWNSCCHRRCVEYDHEYCVMHWGTCWNMHIQFRLQGEARNRVHVLHCGFNELSCVHNIQKQFVIEANKDCWHDPHDDSVQWSEPSEVAPGWWVGVAFGCLFLTCCIVSCLFAVRRLCADKFGADSWRVNRSKWRRRDSEPDTERRNDSNETAAPSSEPPPAYTDSHGDVAMGQLE
eukprot:TRINITY_DN113841_c0_g1_i1.p1 TRINITY_DN113841_c0_g1~~TRINITY_DN113841_c0_g1_i1.p1  ORF type:complete len:296 (-),score=99.78 TRINITY_DN113841_c0_g1_i1:39-926(-)